MMIARFAGQVTLLGQSRANIAGENVGIGSRAWTFGASIAQSGSHARDAMVAARGRSNMAGFPCMKCKRVFMSEKGRARHECGKAKEAKPSKVNHNRAKPKRCNVTAITNKVRQEVNRRSMELMRTDCPVCECCGYARDLTKAHLDNASQGGAGGDPWNIANLCGTHGVGGYDEKGGCHNWADNRPAGRAWKEAKRKALVHYYKTGEGRKHWQI